MENESAVAPKPKEEVQKRIKVELLGPINHDFILYSRGVHELDESLARLFLTYKDPVNRRPLVREWVVTQAAPVRGTTKPAI
jgi:hypothetical protein